MATGFVHQLGQILDDCLKNAKQMLINWLRNAREMPDKFRKYQIICLYDETISKVIKLDSRQNSTGLDWTEQDRTELDQQNRTEKDKTNIIYRDCTTRYSLKLQKPSWSKFQLNLHAKTEIQTLRRLYWLCTTLLPSSAALLSRHFQ